MKKPVLIEWIDSNASMGGWGKPSARTLRPATCVSVGLLIRKTREHVTLAMSTDGTNVLHTLTIPRLLIRGGIRKLKLR